MLRQKLLDLLFQPVLECVRHNCKMQRRRCVFRQVKEPCLNTLERIFKAEIQNFALGCCEIPERLPLRNAQAKPQGQPRLADFRRTREDMQALWNKLIYQKVRRFIRPVFSSSALMVCSLFILSPPSILLSRFLFSISPHQYRNTRIDFWK